MSPTDCEPLQLITVKGLWLILQAPSLVPLLLYLSIWKFPSSGSVLASITDKIVHYLSVYWFQPSPIPPPRRDPPKKICISSAPEHPVWMWGLSFFPTRKMSWTCPKTWQLLLHSVIRHLDSTLLLGLLQKEKLQFMPLYHRESGIMYGPYRLSASLKALIKKQPWKQKT